MPVNRIAKHFDTATATPTPTIPPKDDYKGRYEFVSDAVLRAVAAVTRLLDHDDPAVVMKAAKMIMDLEKTRMRHGKEVHGAPRPESVERAALLPPLPNYACRLKDESEEEDLTPRPPRQEWRGGVQAGNVAGGVENDHGATRHQPTLPIHGEGGERSSPGEVFQTSTIPKTDPGQPLSAPVVPTGRFR